MLQPSFHPQCRYLAGLALVVGVALLVPTGTASAQAAASAARTLVAADRQFITDAAKGGLAEVIMGRIAQQRGSNGQVKRFGVRMVRDHGQANEELKRVATAKAVVLPAIPDAEHHRHAEGLAKLAGAAFDRAYMKHMVDDHQKDIARFEQAAQSAKDLDVKDFAARTLPTLKAHHELAQKTYDAVK